MSWFKRKPPKYPPHKPHTSPHRTSPSTEKTLDDAKKTGPNYDLKYTMQIEQPVNKWHKYCTGETYDRICTRYYW